MAVLITGSSRNIGRALALDFGAAGHDVVVNGRDLAPAQAVADEIVSAGGRALALSADVASENAVSHMVQEAADRLSPVDVLINNAALRFHGALADTSSAEWSGVLAVTLTGAFHCAKAVAPGMQAAGEGRIVNIVGVSGEMGAAQRCAVVAAKSGLLGLTKALALELAEFGITVNAVSPGLMDTARAGERGSEALAGRLHSMALERTPLRRPGRVDEVVAAVRFLTSESASFVTGHVLRVNGGLYV